MEEVKKLNLCVDCMHYEKKERNCLRKLVNPIDGSKMNNAKELDALRERLSSAKEMCSLNGKFFIPKQVNKKKEPKNDDVKEEVK